MGFRLKHTRKKVPIITGIAVAVALICSCSRDAGVASEMGGSSESTSANITGTMYNSDGTRAADAIVTFVPIEYSAYNNTSTAEIETTFTDKNGGYAYEIKSGGFYNVSARKNGASAFEDSVYISTGNKTSVNDTLKAYGSISGVARLDPGDDNRLILVLVLGTNIYAAPRDTSGSFRINELAEGEYVLRILTTVPDYAYADIPATVQSGTNTTLSQAVHLKNNGVPKVGPVEMRYDTNMMFVALSWTPADTAKVAGFYIYENPSYNEEPLKILNPTDSMFIADAIGFSGYTFPVSYSVAAVGKDRSVGKRSTTVEMNVENMFIPVDTIRCVPMTEDYYTSTYFIDGNATVYMTGPGWIARYDNDGKRIAEYVNADYDKCAPLCYNAESENVFALEVFETGTGQYGIDQPDSVTLLKLSPNLDSIASVTVGYILDSNGRKEFPFKIAAGENSTIRLLYDLYDGSGKKKMIVGTYDVNLAEISCDTVPEYSNFPDVLNDTVYISDNPVAEWDMVSIGTNRYPELQYRRPNYMYRFTSGAMLACVSSDIILTDPDFNLIGRCRLKMNTAILGCDGIDHVFIKDDTMNADSETSYNNIIVCKLR